VGDGRAGGGSDRRSQICAWDAREVIPRDQSLDRGKAERNSVNGTFHVSFTHETNRPDASAQPCRCKYTTRDSAGMEATRPHSLHWNHSLRIRSFGRNRKADAKPEVRFSPDQLFVDGTRSRGTRFALGPGTRRRRDRKSAIWIRRSVRQSAFKTTAG